MYKERMSVSRLPKMLLLSGHTSFLLEWPLLDLRNVTKTCAVFSRLNSGSFTSNDSMQFFKWKVKEKFKDVFRSKFFKLHLNNLLRDIIFNSWCSKLMMKPPLQFDPRTLIDLFLFAAHNRRKKKERERNSWEVSTGVLASHQQQS